MGWINLRAVAWARAQTVGSPTHKLVLLMLASCCGSTNDCQVRIATLARDCELDERTVQRALRTLVQLGYLTIRPRAVCGLSRPNEYQLNVDAAKGGTTPPRRGADDSPTPAPNPEQGWRSATPTATQALIEKTKQPLQTYFSPVELPSTLDAAMRADAERLLARLPSDSRQPVADEWAARWRKGDLRNPLVYLAKLVNQSEAGCFQPELAAEERSRRQRAHGSVDAEDAADSPLREARRQQIDELVQKLGQRLRVNP